MDLLTTIKDTVIPDANSIPKTEHASPEHAESNVPGAFPDANEDELARQIQQKEATQAPTTMGHKRQDSGVDLLGQDNQMQSSGAEPKLGSVAAPGDYTPQPELPSWNADRSNERLEASEDVAGRQKDISPDQMEPENIRSATQSGSNTGSNVFQEAARLSEPAAAQSEFTMEQEPAAMETSYQQIPSTERAMGHAAQSGGNTGSGVLEAASAGTTGLTKDRAPQQQQRAYTHPDSEPEAGFSGGIHNGVFGAGSDDIKGERIEGQHERMSQYRKGDVRSSISGVIESGLGQGGIKNGVVGIGSREEEDMRRSLDGQRDGIES